MRKTKQKLFVLSLCLALVSLIAICVGCTAIAGASAGLYLSPATKTVNIGDTFNVDVLVNTSGQNVVVVTAYLHYDPTKLEVVSINTSNSVFTMEIEKTADPSTGEIKITLVKPTPGANTARGNVATINFKALVQASPAYVTFVMTSPGATGDSDIILDDGKGTDILGSVKNGTYFIGGEIRLNAELSLSPDAKTVNIGDNFNVDIQVNTGGQNVNAVGAQLNYDPTKLEVIGIDTSNSVFTMTVEKTADPTTGMIKLTIGKPTPGVNTASGNVATINFKALAQASPACVSFVTDSDRPYITCVCLDDGKGTDILGSVKNGTYFIGGEEQLNAELSLSPTTKAVGIGETFSVDVLVNTNRQNVVAVAAYLHYDPTKLEVVSIDTSNSVFTMEAEKTFDPSTGKIKITLGKPTPGVNTTRGNVATINFKAMAQASPANVTFVFTGFGASGDSGIYNESGGSDILSSVKNGAYFIVGENQPQNASFIYSPLNPVVNGVISFDASLSTDFDGMIKSWEWDFGDGSYGNGVIVTHAYSTVGNYKVTLTVTDNDDAKNSTSKTIQVRSPPIYVPDDYPTIQWAVDNATGGDTIIVRDGLYTENIDVNKPHLMIKSENGSENCIVQAANYNDHVFEVTVDYVNISGFTVKGATGDWQNSNAGIYINRCGYCNISNNIALHNDLGIYLYKSYSNILIDNIANQNLHVGIWLYESSNNSLISNMAESNNDYGFFLCFFSNNNTLINNIASEKDIGFAIRSSSNNTVVDNTVSNTIHGITLSFSSDNNIIINNKVSNNWDGIRLYESFNNVITNNTATNNSYGIYLYSSSNNLIYLNNFVNNAGNTHSYWSTNAWNSTSPITYTYNGNTHTNYLGNYWDDYKRSDANDNGIGDTAYRINSDKDDYPLMEPWENYPFLSEALTSKIEVKTKVEEVNNVIKLGNTLFWRLWRR